MQICFATPQAYRALKVRFYPHLVSRITTASVCMCVCVCLFVCVCVYVCVYPTGTSLKVWETCVT